MSYQSLSLRFEDNQLWLLDQTLLPFEEKWLKIQTLEEMLEAIKALRVRGAPLIGIAAAFMVAQVAKKMPKKTGLTEVITSLRQARPTAVNLMYCMDEMTKILNSSENPAEDLLRRSIELFSEDKHLCDKMATFGASLIQDGDQIVTHCNTGGLATAGVGTALGVIQKSFEMKKKVHVYVDETRPLLQGGRLTTWELEKLGIPFTLICDNMAAHLMQQGKITKAIVGADRIALNGDFANKVGTYGLAVCADFHKIPFYVAAPYTTLDKNCSSGSQIPIEERPAREVTGVSGHFGEVHWAKENTKVFNPAFDVTPGKLVDKFILDRGIFSKENISKAF